MLITTFILILSGCGGGGSGTTPASTNTAPSFTSSAVVTATEAQIYTYNITTTDSDTNDTLTITAPMKPTWLNFTDSGNKTATLTATPSSTDVGIHDVIIRVTDSAGAYIEQTFTITVSGATVTSFTVTAAAGVGGSITPVSATVNSGSSTTFTVTADSNYFINSVAGCSGSLSGDIFTTGVVTSDCTVTASFSNNPPVLSNASPTNILVSGTISTILSLSTNENAICKYSTSANTSYTAMINFFSTTGGVSHSQTLTGLQDGTAYTYYVRCSDSSNNQTTTDYTISFSVDSSPALDSQAPSVPTDVQATALSSSQISLSWSASTDNVGVTGYKIYRDGTQISTTTDTSYTDLGLTTQSLYSYAVSAFDGAGNNSNQSLQVQATTDAGGAALPAFPGAEGLGAHSVGGRGGTVVKVTNLNDSGPGSFRQAVYTDPRHYAGGAQTYTYESEENYIARLDNEGHKTIVFDVSGIINLESALTIRMPYLTIAGETSPGGVMITGYQTTIMNHDVIMRHMRFRVGSHRITDGSGADPEQLDSFDILGKYWGGVNADNIIIDHCSFGWGVDETVTFSGGVTNTTIQWSIIAEGLSQAGHPKGEHSKGFLVSGKYVYPISISGHHNYLAHNRDRNPLLASPADVDVRVDWVNNIAYNWHGGLSLATGGAAKVNWDNNYARQGASSNSYSFEITMIDFNTAANPQIYVYGNIGSTRMSQSEADWNVGFEWRNQLLSEDWRRTTRWDTPRVTTSVMSEAVANEILTKVGATKPFRDSVDARVIADFAAGTGSIRDNVIFPDDFPIFQNVTPPTDSDNDGMADSWEIATFGNISRTHNGDEDGDGYTNIEEYLHFLAGE